MQLRTRLNRDRPQSTSQGGFDRDQDVIQFCLVPERTVQDSDSDHMGVSWLPSMTSSLVVCAEQIDIMPVTLLAATWYQELLISCAIT